MTNRSQESGYELTVPIDCPPGENPAEIYLSGLDSHHSRRNLSRYLNQVAAFLSNGYCDAMSFNWPELRVHHLATVLALFAEEYSISTVNGMLSSVRGVMRESQRLGQISQEVYDQIITIPNIKRPSPYEKGRVLSLKEVQALLLACGIDRTEPSAKERRDAAIIGLLYSTGMRRSELVELCIEDYHSNASRLQIVTGNPDQDRAVILKPQPKLLLDNWLKVRDDGLGPLFNPVNKGGRVLHGLTITTQAVYNIVQARSKQAGLEPVKPHDLRRTFVIEALKVGVKTSIVAEIAGHISIDTTRRYKRQSEKY